MADGPGSVQVLPDALANQIAAGEVIERPASVVKELVENALDADATKIFVTLDGAGQRRIQVLDDGHGMHREDAIRCVVRHATSKIAHADDLRAIHTLGFRGEALPSIASVSRFTLVTRPAGLDAATELRIDGGDRVQVRDSGAPPGTCVTIEDLFYNVPARRKFLKADATETGHVKTLISAFSLAFPYVHFRLLLEGKKSIDHPAVKRLEQRVHQVLGKTTFGRLHPVTSDGPIQIRGYIAEPHFSRTNQSGIHTFVNGRRVRDRTVTHGLISAYGTLLDRGRFPWAVLYVTLAPEDVDVNVHPAKAEVRFADPQAVHTAIARACRVTLGGTPWRRSSSSGPARHDAGPLFRDTRAMPHVSERRAPLGRSYRPHPQPPAPHPPQVLDFRSDPAHPSGAPSPSPAAPSPSPPAPTDARLHLVGLGGRDYIIAQRVDAIVTIDCRRATQLIARQHLLDAIADGRPLGQPLLFPLQGEPEATLADAMATHREALATLGLMVEPFGGGTWQITEVPAPLSGASAWDLVRVALEALSRHRGHPAERAVTAAADALSALAPRPGDLSKDSAQTLLSALSDVAPDVVSGAVHATPYTVLDRYFSRDSGE